MPSPPGQCRAAVGGDGGLNMRQAAAGRKRGVGLCPLEWTRHHWCRRDPVNAIDRITIDPAVCGGRRIAEAGWINARRADGEGAGTGQGDYGSEVISTLLKRMEDQRGLFFVFVAGYTEQMETFLKSNPGLNSRFDRVLKFEDYDTNELLQIAQKMLTENNKKLNEEAESHLRNYLDYLYRTKDKYFANARVIRNLIQDIVRQQQIRLSKGNAPSVDPEFDKIITMEDLETIVIGKDRRDIFNKPRLGFMPN